jgi:hypothetical protein
MPLPDGRSGDRGVTGTDAAAGTRITATDAMDFTATDAMESVRAI